ncbi:MAG: hypothetical protein C4575_13280 [Desulforudis sp.]|nr:MAG: hypothetical protein C4575_13280 [Desulforudis sp.]
MRRFRWDIHYKFQDGRVLVPFRAVGEIIGAKVTWQPETGTCFGDL